MSRAKVWVVPGYLEHRIERMFDSEGYLAFTMRSFPKEKPDFICLTGGSDVNPAVYGEENKGSYGFDDKRDAFELSIWEEYKDKGVTFLGICRGAQLLNVLNGGRMIQDLPTGHHGLRPIIDWNGVEHWTDECHHQGMIAHESGQVLATDPVHLNDEVIWYPQTQCFCFQAHPEYGKGTQAVFFGMLYEATTGA